MVKENLTSSRQIFEAKQQVKVKKLLKWFVGTPRETKILGLIEKGCSQQMNNINFYYSPYVEVFSSFDVRVFLFVFILLYRSRLQ
jgi:hypothetical protein